MFVTVTRTVSDQLAVLREAWCERNQEWAYEELQEWKLLLDDGVYQLGDEVDIIEYDCGAKR